MSKLNPGHTFYFFNVNINIILSHVSGSPMLIFPSVFWPEILYEFLLSFIHIICFTHFILLLLPLF